MRALMTMTSLILLTAAANAEAPALARTVSVTGTVVDYAAPDIIVWNISLVHTDKSLIEGKKQNDESLKSILSLREKLGIEKGDMQTGQVSIRREYERGQYRQRGAFKHFVVNRSVTVYQRDLSRFDEFLDTLVASTELEVSFSFKSTRMQEVRSEARTKAVQVAKTKAEAMARVAGATLGKVITLNEHNPTSSWQNPMSNSAYVTPPAVTDSGSESFVPGSIQVRVTVYATFELR